MASAQLLAQKGQQHRSQIDRLPGNFSGVDEAAVLDHFAKLVVVGCGRKQDRRRRDRAAVGHEKLPVGLVASQPGKIVMSEAGQRGMQSTLTEDGGRTPALRFGDPRVMALLGALCIFRNVLGFTNKSPRYLLQAGEIEEPSWCGTQPHEFRRSLYVLNRVILISGAESIYVALF